MKGATEMGTKYCRYCGRYVSTTPRYRPNQVAWVVLILVTCGAALPLFLLAMILAAVQGEACNYCGR